MKKVLIIMGTRPEVIKCYPVIKALREDGSFEVTVVFTGQHRELLKMMVEDLGISDYKNLEIFKEGQTLSEITSMSLTELEKLDELKNKKFDYCLVQGDTTTVFAGALWAFYHKIPIGHIEAGLRSNNLFSPYPEEANRKMVSTITSYHFAPTEKSRENLLKEGIDDRKIYVTGNTVIDALNLSVRENYKFQNDLLNKLKDKKKILLTAHRRENQESLSDIFRAIKDAINDKDIELIFPMHPTPRVRQIASKELIGDNIHLIEPLSYKDMVHLLKEVRFVVTDSGGLQEEAPGFGKPVVVIREETERQEGVEAGTCKLVGTSYDAIKNTVTELLKDSELYNKMTKAINPYGDGKASQRIVNILKGD